MTIQVLHVDPLAGTVTLSLKTQPGAIIISGNPHQMAERIEQAATKGAEK